MIAGKHILLVEDEALIAMLLEDLVLELGGVVVGPVCQLDQAIAFAQSRHLDAAILDINLGGKRSYPVADVLRERGIPFAFASGYGAQGVGESHRSAPVMVKPFSRDELASTLTNLLQNPG